MKEAEDQSARLRRVLACLGDPSRFRLVRAVAEAERCVTELAGLVGLSQSCTTRHLQALSREGLVLSRRAGRRVVFRLESENAAVANVLAWALERSDAAMDAAGTPSAADRREHAGESEVVRRRARRAASHGGIGGARTGTRGPEGESNRQVGVSTGEVMGADGPAEDTKPTSAEAPKPRPGDIEDFLL